ncbi:MAG: secretion protein [Clostridiales bacterium]|nr:secretion protein [Clostridiales bacterium]
MAVNASASYVVWETNLSDIGSGSCPVSVNGTETGCLGGIDLDSIISQIGSRCPAQTNKNTANCPADSAEVSGTCGTENSANQNICLNEPYKAGSTETQTAPLQKSGTGAYNAYSKTSTSTVNAAEKYIKTDDSSAIFRKSNLTDLLNSILARYKTGSNKTGVGTQATPKPTEGKSGNAAPSSSPDPAGSTKADSLYFEKRVVELVNQQRAANGLAPLTLSTALSNAARAKSQDMHDKKYFSHNSPTYGSPFDMLKSFGISYRTAGENIAMGYTTPEAVMNAWMNSPGHRANILNASYTKIGVGYVADGNYWTQEFIG